MKTSSLATSALAVLLAPGLAAAHGVALGVERRGKEVSVRARYADGGPLAGARFVVLSPAKPADPFAQGTTDRDGRLAFAPDVPGTWKVRVVDATGHGGVVDVEVAPAPPAGAPAEDAAAAPSPRGPPTGTARRLALGVAAVVLVFGGLWLAGRRRRAAHR